MKSILIILIISDVFARSVKWSVSSGDVITYAHEILKVHQMETIGEYINCNVSINYEIYFGSNSYSTTVSCDGDMYKPPTLEHAKSILCRVPKEMLSARLLQIEYNNKKREYNKISQELKTIIVTLWNKGNINENINENIKDESWDQIIDYVIKNN